jgi:hydroxylamine reductase
MLRNFLRTPANIDLSKEIKRFRRRNIIMVNKMFCYQCQETAGCTGCTKVGVCGKKPEVAAMQDLLVYVTKGISAVTTALRAEGKKVSSEINHLVTSNMFTTITNANFDEDMIVSRILETLEKKEELLKQLDNKNDLPEAATWYSSNRHEFALKAAGVGVLSTKNEDIRSLRELITYGLKGLSAYSKHANALLKDNEEVDAFLQRALAKTLDDTLGVDDLVALTLETGKYGVNVMELLDKANTSSYGNPEITKVNIGVRNNPGILISGHDLRDLEMLLKQTEGTGVDVYTHSEMLPAHYYPAFKKYSHFAGNYGNAWWKQKEEFESFNGPILMTSNCIVPPKASYKDRLYTTGAAGFPGCKHIKGEVGEEKDFSQIIEHAKKCAPPVEIESGEIIGGFAHNQVLALADKIVDAVKSGAIKKFVVMAGCDGRARSRNYYTDFAKALPKDAIILTAGCAKYKYNKLQLGDIGGIPRVLDAGQCNDSYSLAVIALKLKEVFGLEDINDLPIVYNIAWYEQKAVIVLLALLYLGVKNIHLGPTLPAFLSENVAKVLVENFGIAGIGSVEDDIKLFFEK